MSPEVVIEANNWIKPCSVLLKMFHPVRFTHLQDTVTSQAHVRVELSVSPIFISVSFHHAAVCWTSEVHIHRIFSPVSKEQQSIE